jgi:hypothetical protein
MIIDLFSICKEERLLVADLLVNSATGIIGANDATYKGFQFMRRSSLITPLKWETSQILPASAFYQFVAGQVSSRTFGANNVGANGTPGSTRSQQTLFYGTLKIFAQNGTAGAINSSFDLSFTIPCGDLGGGTANNIYSVSCFDATAVTPNQINPKPIIELELCSAGFSFDSVNGIGAFCSVSGFYLLGQYS